MAMTITGFGFLIAGLIQYSRKTATGQQTNPGKRLIVSGLTVIVAVPLAGFTLAAAYGLWAFSLFRISTGSRSQAEYEHFIAHSSSSSIYSKMVGLFVMMFLIVGLVSVLTGGIRWAFATKRPSNSL
jgi:hypothetical protein